MIPRFDAAALLAGNSDAIKLSAQAAMGVGFMTVYNTPLSALYVQAMIDNFSAFYHLPAFEKSKFDMAVTGSNRDGVAQGQNR